MKKRFTEQQIIGFLKEVEAGMPVKKLCGKHEFSHEYHRPFFGLFSLPMAVIWN